MSKITIPTVYDDPRRVVDDDLVRQWRESRKEVDLQTILRSPHLSRWHSVDTILYQQRIVAFVVSFFYNAVCLVLFLLLLIQLPFSVLFNIIIRPFLPRKVASQPQVKPP